MGSGWVTGVKAIGSSPTLNNMATMANGAIPSTPLNRIRYWPMASATRLTIM